VDGFLHKAMSQCTYNQLTLLKNAQLAEEI